MFTAHLLPESFPAESLEALRRALDTGHVCRLTGLHGSGKTFLLQRLLSELMERSSPPRVFVVVDPSQRAAWRAPAAHPPPSVAIGSMAELVWEIFISMPEFRHYAGLSGGGADVPRLPSFGAMFFPSLTGVADWHLVDMLRHWSRQFSGLLDEAALQSNVEMTFPGRSLLSLLTQYEHESMVHLSNGLRTDITSTMAWLLQLPPPDPFPYDYIFIDSENLLTPLEVRLLSHWARQGPSLVTTHDPFFQTQLAAWQTGLPSGFSAAGELQLVTIPNFFFFRSPRSVADFLNVSYFPEPYPCYNPTVGSQQFLPPSPYIWMREKIGAPFSPLPVSTRWLSSLPVLQNLEFLSVTAFCSPRYLSFFYYLLHYFRQESHLIPRTVHWLLHLRAIFDDHFGYLNALSALPGAGYRLFIHDAFSLFHTLFQIYQISSLEHFSRLGHLFTLHPLSRITVHLMDEMHLSPCPSLVLFGANHFPLQWHPDAVFHEQYLHYHTLSRVTETLFLSSSAGFLPFYHPV